MSVNLNVEGDDVCGHKADDDEWVNGVGDSDPDGPDDAEDSGEVDSHSQPFPYFDLRV